MEHPRGIIVLDFGGQYAHLIASRVRRMGAFSQILEPETSIEKMKGAAGIILSGGPQSVYDEASPQADPAIFDLGIPVLGLCYGLHWMTQTLGGDVKGGDVKEYGKTDIRNLQTGSILKDCPDEFTVWMSHGDEAATLPEGFELIATSAACKNAAFENTEKKFFALQFHPEVTHTEHGGDILRRFVTLCDADPWSIESYSAHIAEEVTKEVGDKKVFMLVSGGVDSSVAFTLLNKVLGPERVQGLLVDTGLMRKNEVSQIKKAFDALGITNLHVEDASEEFFANLKDVHEPEEKRKIMGSTFLDVQKRVSEEMNLKMEDGWMLGQGTIYPDTIETGATKHADQIKTHHNRVEEVQKMIDAGLVIEPLKDLYKDEVRLLGEELGLPHELVWRHPFPGPGLGVRILCATKEDYDYEKPKHAPDNMVDDFLKSHVADVLPVRSVGVQGDGRTFRHAVALYKHKQYEIGEEQRQLATTIPNSMPGFSRVAQCTSHTEPIDFHFTPGYITRDRADLLREADTIVDEEMRAAALYETIWQFPVVLLPFGASEGSQSIVLRPISSTDAMTASAVYLQSHVLQKMTERILTLDGVDMVFLDLTNKPPGTIEWE